MSLAPRSRSLIRPSLSIRSAALQRFSSSSSSSPSSSSSNAPPIIASLLLSRAPLLTPTPTELEKTYYDYSRSIKHSLSSPLPTEFYFKSGSLPLRRYLKAEHEYETEIYGERLAGGKPDNIGDIPPETEYEILPRNHWEEKDKKDGKGEKSLERYPEEEVYCLLQSKDKKKWVFPSTIVERLQSLDEAINDNIIGPNGQLDGKGMDSWLVTRKPVGVVREGEQRTFFLRGHILAGQPTLTPSSNYTSHAWLNVREVEDRLRKQGDEKLWESVKGMFGIPEQEVEES